MVATIATTFLHLSVSPPLSPPPIHKLSLLPKQLTNRCSISSPSPFTICKLLVPRSLSSPQTSSTVEEEEEENQAPDPDSDPLSSLSPIAGCKGCGRVEIENGCNGEGRIQGGIATYPGFGWWPIKAYRPCPAFVASGGRYSRTGQSMDQVISGVGRARKTSDQSNVPQSSKKKEGAKKSKR